MPDAVRVERDLGGREPGQPRAQRLRRGQVAGPDHELGLVRSRELRVPEQQVVVRDRRLAATCARQRIGEQRDSSPRGEASQLAGRAGVAVRARDDHDPPRRRRATGGSARATRIERHVRPGAGATGVVVGQRQRAVEHERLAEREVEVDRSRRALDRGPVGAAGQRADKPEGRRGRVIDPDLEEPLDRVAVDLQLVDRLAGADLAELRRAVGGEHDQRHACVPRLDHRRREVRRGGTGRACHRDRSARTLAGAEREEAGAALVDVRPAPDPLLAHERKDDRGAARPRRGAGVFHPTTRELVAEGAQQQVGVGGGHDAG